MRAEWFDTDTQRWYPIDEIVTSEGEVLPAKILPFKPSNDQMIRYMKHKGHTVPRKKTKVNNEAKWMETAVQKEVAKLAKRTRDPLYKAVLEYKGCETAISRYVDKWQPLDDGRVHSEFLYVPASGQLNSQNPNAQNYIRSASKDGVDRKYMTSLRGMIEAPEGFKLVEFDYNSCHSLTTGFEARDLDYMRLAVLDMHSFVTAHFCAIQKLIPSSELPNLKWSDGELKECLASFKKRFPQIRDTKAKPCIAEGELVLTDKGLIPIERVTIDMKVWDGVEYVKHEGVICKGYKEVITYDGLTATPDHKVYTEALQQISMRDAASKMARIASTGIGGTAIRTSESNKSRSNKNKGLSLCRSAVSRMPRDKMALVRFIKIQENKWLSKVWNCCKLIFNKRKSSCKSLRFNLSKMYKSKGYELGKLWRSWNRMQVFLKKRIYSVCDRKSSNGCLFAKYFNRQNQQRWTLRTGQFTPIYATGAILEQENYSLDDLRREKNSSGIIQEPLRRIMDEQVSKERFDWRGNNCEGNEKLQIEIEEVAANRDEVKRAWVYDIVNAGPRHRFTVSDKLVANCGLGYGFGMGPHRLHRENEDTIPLKDAKLLMQLMDDLFPVAKEWRKQIKFLADRQGYLVSRHGFIRWFWDVYSRKLEYGKWVTSNGSDAEDAIAFLPSNDGHGLIQQKMVELEASGANDKYNLINMIHDALLYLMPESLISEGIEIVKNKMVEPSSVLVDTLVAPNGLSVGVDVKFGQSWDRMEKWQG